MHPRPQARPTPAARHGGPRFQLRFDSLVHSGRSLRFPCDARGQVPLDELGERSRNDYFFARATTGRDFARPVVEPIGEATSDRAATPAIHPDSACEGVTVSPAATAQATAPARCPTAGPALH